MPANPPDPSLDKLRTQIDAAVNLIGLLIRRGHLKREQRSECAKISSVLTSVAVKIDNSQLASRNAAITQLIKQLGDSSESLDKIHQRAVDIKDDLDIAQDLLDGFGAFADAVGPSKDKSDDADG